MAAVLNEDLLRWDGKRYFFWHADPAPALASAQSLPAMSKPAGKCPSPGRATPGTFAYDGNGQLIADNKQLQARLAAPLSLKHTPA